uniref:VWFA domain-containing protein n=1 Tax=Monopterus albus TaxID=43700 RepID=A0A3Q3JFZ5_MONAL
IMQNAFALGSVLFGKCPVDLFFVLDTSESVALRQKPPDFYIGQIKEFTMRFIDELKDMRHRCDRTLTWNSGALHYSDEVIVVRELSELSTDRQALKDDINKIKYIGKGTYTDCAIKRGLAELLVGGTHYHENKYIVVVTDGHPVTGYKEPCGGVQEAANEAKHHGVKVFAVAISPDQEDTRLSLIATDHNYRQNFTAADEARSTKMGTIQTIINMITNETKDVTSTIILFLHQQQHTNAHAIGQELPNVLEFSIAHSLIVYLSFAVLQGRVGDPGPVGYSGMKGDKGRGGNDGIDGRKGEPGFPGLSGCKGSPGSDGHQGEPGPKGDPGSYGQKGAKGDTGRDGEPGRPGNYGQLGPQGDRGPPGANGDKGERGDDGAPGQDGPRGERGQAGEKGEQGSRGNRGPRGEPVSDGEAGKPGPPGYRGDEGPIGPEGPKGPRGIKGAPGDRGQIGERVSVGETDGGKGTPGPKGDDGEPGDPGPDVSLSLSLFKVRFTHDLVLSLFRPLLAECCKCAPLDLAFIVDSSESIGEENFRLAKDFIITVIDRLIKDQHVKFAANESGVSVVQYSGSKAQEIVRLGFNTNNLHDFKEAVRGLRWLAEATYTGEALDFALTRTIKLMKKENRVVLVLTDGRSDITRDRVPLNVLCGQNLNVVGLGVKDYSGREPNPEQIGDLACKSDPKPGISLVLENFAELLNDAFLQNLTSTICQAKKCPDYKCPISFRAGADILMMMDSSASVGQKNFEISKAFVRHMADRFLTAEKQRGATVRVGAAQYSRNANLEQGLTTNLTLLSQRIEEAAFQNDGTNVLEAMQFAITTLRGRGDASGGTKKLVLFSDGRSQAVTQPVLEKRVREVADAGVELFVIAVGNQVNEVNLRTLVSKGRPDNMTYAQRHLFRVSDYPSLLRGVFYQTVSRRVSMP